MNVGGMTRSEVAGASARALMDYIERPPGWNPRPHQIPPPGNWYGWLLNAGRGAGKPLDVDTPIPTPSGWTTMGKLQPGDIVFAHDGQPTTVLEAYDPGVTDAWRVTFDDDTELIAGGGHEWTAIIGKHAQDKYRVERDLRNQHADWWKWQAPNVVTGRPLVMPTADIVERARALHEQGMSWRKISDAVRSEFPNAQAKEYCRKRLKQICEDDAPAHAIRSASARHRASTIDTLTLAALRDDNVAVWIPTAMPLVMPNIDLPIDPYIFGMWLGDGSTKAGSICAGTEDADYVRSQLVSRGYAPDRETGPDRGVFNFVSRRLGAELRSVGLTGNRGPKRVSDIFLRASYEQRLDLIRGIMDTDGHATYRSADAGFINEDIANALYELATSVGYIARRWTRWLKATDRRPRRPFFVVGWRPSPDINPFKMPRKANVVRAVPRAQASRKTIRRVESVTRVEDRQLRCISVSADSQLFLAGRAMIPTHNTRTCSQYIIDHVKGPPCLPGSTPHWIGIIAPTLGDAVTACFSGPSGIGPNDPTARLAGGLGGTVIKWNNGSQAKLFGASGPEDIERLRAGGNTCVVAGTLVKTERGEVPIENVRVGDRVWTRTGLQRVLQSAQTGVKRVWRVRTASGRELELTGNHEVLVNGAWRATEFLKPGDTLTTWPEITLSTMASSGISEKTHTTRIHDEDCFTDTSTSSITEQSRKDWSCITSTRTIGAQPIPLVLKRSHKKNTYVSIPDVTSQRVIPSRAKLRGKIALRNHTLASVAHGRSFHEEHQLSTAQSAMLHDTQMEKFPVAHTKDGCALCAAVNSLQLSEHLHVPAHRPVDRGQQRRRAQSDMASSALLKNVSAQSVVRSSVSIPTVPLVLAQDHVLSVKLTERVVPVYDIMVEHDHEFFANGVLVANCAVWMEELAAWRHLDACYQQVRFGLRTGKTPRWVASTTPKPRPLIKKLVKQTPHNVVVTHATTHDNPYLEQTVRDELFADYEGTQIGRQELLAEVMEQDENALWRRDDVDAYRVKEAPELVRVTVGVDPSGGAGEQGIVVAGKHVIDEIVNGRAQKRFEGYVLADMTCHLGPAGWGMRAVRAAIDWEADDIVVETNYGGEMAVVTIRDAALAMGVTIPVKMVVATRGKRVRAEPVAALSTRGQWHHVGTFDALEDQLCTWTPELGYSPDRLDAMVWTAWHNKIVATRPRGMGSFAGGGSMSRSIG